MVTKRIAGIVTGLPLEAEVLLRALPKKGEAQRPVIACHGPGPDRARLAAREALDRGASALASFGLAGALDPDFAPGDIVVAAAVKTTGRTPIAADEQWHRNFMLHADNSLDLMPVTLLQSNDVVSNPQDKAALGKMHGAQAVDMESYAIAEVAKDTGVPFIAVRVISDRVEQELPEAALAGMAPDGKVKVTPVISALLKSPDQFSSLMALAKQTGIARKALKRLAEQALPSLYLQ